MALLRQEYSTLNNKRRENHGKESTLHFKLEE